MHWPIWAVFLVLRNKIWKISLNKKLILRLVINGTNDGHVFIFSLLNSFYYLLLFFLLFFLFKISYYFNDYLLIFLQRVNFKYYCSYNIVHSIRHELIFS